MENPWTRSLSFDRCIKLIAHDPIRSVRERLRHHEQKKILFIFLKDIDRCNFGCFCCFSIRFYVLAPKSVRYGLQ